MRAVGFLRSLPINDPESLLDVEVLEPEARPRDLLIEIEAVALNPVDVKRRIRTAVEKPHPAPMVLGYDAVGIVRALGAEVTGFAVGDRVWYAGDVNRPGSNAERQCVDERIVSRTPASVPPEAAVSLPLTALTAWELLFDRLQVPDDDPSAFLMIIGGAGGVGSITIQLARGLTGLTVIATASREQSAAWCRKMGAHHVVDHRNLVAEVRAAGFEFVDTIVQYADTAAHWDAMCELIAPQGRIGTIVEASEKVNISALQRKSAGLMWELMFTRSMFGTADMDEQGKILARVARLVDEGVIATTETQVMHGLSAATFREAHRAIESGAMIGKLVVKF